MSEPSRRALFDVFGFPRFRGRQEEIIDHISEGKDALVVMPTGAGKSLCYQLPAILRPGVAVVVSPLIALMHDQVQALRARGVRAAFLNSSLSYEESRQVRAAMHRGELDLVYLAPERLAIEGGLKQFQQIPLALFAVDEAHCISHWGHDFRPDYLQLSILRKTFPQVPVVALTATADELTRDDIVRQLSVPEAERFVTGFDRPNIRYTITPRHDWRAQLLRFVSGSHKGHAGIVYCRSRAKTESTAEWLQAQGIRAIPYHAGMGDDRRRRNQDRFLHDESLVVVATVAFGLGVDKPDIRFVAHADIPKSVEAYYQETGRAGRDGEPADAWMLYAPGDLFFVRRLIADSEASDEYRHVAYAKLDRLVGLCETPTCRRMALLRYFGDKPAGPCGNCDTCLGPPRTADVSSAARLVLQCMAQLGHAHRQGYVLDILAGRTSPTIRQLGHDRLDAFGAARRFPHLDWEKLLREMVTQDVVRIDLAHGFVLRPGERMEECSQERATVCLRSSEQAPPRERRPRHPALDDDIIADLRRLRGKLARQTGVNPRKILTNDMVKEIARRRPTDREELGAVKGMTARKIANFGEQILSVVREHAAAPPGQTQEKVTSPSPGRSKTRADEKPKGSGPLWEALRAERLRLAREAKIPAFRIFSDKALTAIARARPTTLEQLLALPGVSPAKVEAYGDIVLQVVRSAVAGGAAAGPEPATPPHPPQDTAPPPAPPAPPATASAAEKPPRAPRPQSDLLGDLRALRGELARQRKVPDFAIFPDYTLDEMAARRPQDLQTLGTVSGVLKSKLEDFGPRFLEVLRES